MRLIKENVERIADGAQANKLKVLGFKEIVSGRTSEDASEQKTLSDMSVTELKELAKKVGIDGANSLTKAELLSVLKDVKSDD